MGMYGERVGALSLVTADPEASKRCESQIKQVGGVEVVLRVCGGGGGGGGRSGDVCCGGLSSTPCHAAYCLLLLLLNAPSVVHSIA